MFELKKVFLLLCVFLCKSNAIINATDYSELIETNNVYNNVSVYQLSWMSSLFNHHEWKYEFLQNTSGICKKHATEYIRELKKGNSWASKMYDASGRYSGQFFFGNDFWLGSSTLCWELENPNTNREVPPFRVRFTVTKIHLTLSDNEAPTSRHLNVGQCLPTSCTTADIKSIMEFDTLKTLSEARNTTVSIVLVRPVPGDYNIYEDVKFYILCGVTITMMTIVTVATFYEVYSSKRKQKTDEEQQNSTNNNNEIKNNEIPLNGMAKIKMEKTKIDVAKGIPSKLLLCFSASSNTKKILSVEHSQEDAIKCIHGLRFLSIAWIIMVHTYLQVFAIAENKTLRILTERYYVYQTISNATFSVDSFFFISGFLVTILYFRTTNKNKSSFEDEKTLAAFLSSTKRFFLLVFYRFLRLTPAYLFVLGVNEVSMRYFYNNSVFEPGLYDHITCDKYWWRNALYINTWYPSREICMLWSWYMSNDTQFYIMALLLLLVAVRGPRHFKIASSIVLVFLATSWVTTFIVAYQYNYQARIEEPFTLFDELYDKPWMRVGPYLIGMITGWFIFRINGKLKLPGAIVTACWLGCIAILMSLVYGLGKDGLQVPLSAFYASLGHTAWGLALAWITLACCTGYGGPINTLLSFRGFLPFSRLTYCAYLVHPMLQCIISFQMDGPLHLHNGMVLVIHLGNVVTAFMVSFFISLGFEAPVLRLLKVIMGGRGKDD